MARLNAFKVNSKAIQDGEWIKLEDFDGLEIKTRGYNDNYYDALNRKNRQAAKPFGGDLAKVPNAIQRDIRTACIVDHLLLDVRGLEDDSGNPVDFATFCDLLRHPDFGALVILAMNAAGEVGRTRDAERADAAGN